MFALLRAQQRLALSYQQAALAEYLASCRAHGLAAPPSLAALYVDLLLDQVGVEGGLAGAGAVWCCGACLHSLLLDALQVQKGRLGAARSCALKATTPQRCPLNAALSTPQGLPHLVAPLLLSHPQLDSAVLAEHVEEAAAAGRLPGGAQLADQLLLRLGAHKARCALLLRTGRTAQALRLAKQHRLLGQLAPAALLDASASTGDALLFAAAHRLCAAQAQRAGGALQGLAEAAEAHHQRFQPAQFQALKAAAG